MMHTKLVFVLKSILLKGWKRGVLALCVLCIGISVCAQEPDSIQLTQMVVAAKKANKIPALQSKQISDEILATSSTQSIGDILKNHSTVFIKDYGPSNIQTPTFRGMSSSHTKIYVNGLDISPGSLGQSDLNILPSFLFDGVGLKYGNTSFTEGPGAIGGGVMLATNEQGKKKGHTGNLGVSYGSFNTITAQGEYAFTKEKWQSVTRFILQSAENDFTYRNVAQKDYPTQTQEHGEKNMQGLMQAFKFSPNWKNTLDVMILGTMTDRKLPALMTSTSPSKETQSDQLFSSQLGWKRYIKKGRSKLVVGYTWNNLHYEDPDSEINSVTLNQRFQVREDFVRKLNETWSVKTMGLFEYSTANNPNYVGNSDIIQGSVLLGVNGKPSKKWDFGLYAQPTWNNSSFEFLPMASFAFKPLGTEKLTVGLNASKNVHFPTLNDLYWVPGGNADLQPEKSVNGEVNVHNEGRIFKFANYEIAAAGFYGEVDNWILWQPTDKSYWEAQNIKTVQHSGMDASLSLNKRFKNWVWKFQTSYQFVKAINKEVLDESLNKQLIYTPNHLANWFIRADYKDFWFQVHYSFTGIRYITTSNSAYLPAFDLVNVSGGLKLITKNNKRFHVQLNVNNVLGKEYMSVVYRAMPGSNFNVSVKYVMD